VSELASIPRSGSRLGSRIWRYRYQYLLLLVPIAYYLLFKYVPMFGVILGFKKFMFNKGILGSPWIGLLNFQKAFDSMIFWRVFRNTLVISAGKILFAFPAPIILAILLNEVRLRPLKRTVQTGLYLPHFISWVILAGIVTNMLGLKDGLINKIIASLGGMPTAFLVKEEWFRPIVFISQIWKETGWSAIIYLASLAAINPEIYEAALMDGAGRFRRFLYVTWPHLMFTVAVMLILQSGSVMNAGFDQIFNLYNQAVYSTGDILDTYIYRETLMKGDFSYGTAVGLIQASINCLLLFTVDRTVRLLQGHGLYE
jgi:putative aldouronate transport system permease protein